MDPRGKPVLDVQPVYINVEDSVHVRCEAERGTSCDFYIDQNAAPFRSEPFSEKYKVCVLNLSGKELLGERGIGTSAEVFLSCAVQLVTEGQKITSQCSEWIRLKVDVQFGSLRIDMDLKRINTDQNATIRCEAERGTRCHFYTDKSKAPFRSVPFREQYKVCSLTVSGKELLGQRGAGIRTDVVLSCAVELVTLGQTSTSQRSESITVEVEGLENNVMPATATISAYSKSNIPIIEPTGPGQLPKTFIWVAAVELVSLMATAVLSCLYFKHKVIKQDSERDLEHENNIFQTVV
ncbi:uncharacterized protein [Lepisosteus oculatus]|uniref:uncharacterized protein n=1 Tax=Lepisosteus oculatus TaxID=7918 RepID=UPI0035F51FD3